MFFVVKKTAAWVQKGLITEQQAKDIVAFEKQRKSIFSVVSVIMFVGLFSVACGIVALISANWQDIPDVIKLAGMLGLLSATGRGLFKIKNTKPALFEAGVFFYMLLFFAAIGLVGQIYHLKSDTYRALLFWSAMTLPVVLMSSVVWVGAFWEAFFVGALASSPVGQEVLEFLCRRLLNSPWGWSFISLAAFFMLLPVKKAPVFVKPLKIAVFAQSLLLLMVSGERWLKNCQVPTHQILFFVATLGGFALFAHKAKAFTAPQKKCLFALTGIFGGGYLVAAATNACFVRELAFIAQIVVLMAGLITAYCFDALKISRALGVVTAFRILIVFFDLFGTLMQTGVGLIVAGGMILGIAYGCYKIDGWLKRNLTGKEKGHE